MNALFKMIDRLFSSVPANVQKMVRLGALVVWGALAVLVFVWSFRSGSDSVPQSGEDLYLSNIKEKVYRDRMKRNPSEVTLPDLKELSKEEVAPLSVYQPEARPPGQMTEPSEQAPLPLKGERDGVVFPEKGIRPEIRSETAPAQKTPADEPRLLPNDR